MSLPGASLYDAIQEHESSYYGGTLLELRKRFVRDTSRYNMVLDAENDDWRDNPKDSADRWLNDGIRFLDRLWRYHKDSAWLFKLVKPGEQLITFSRARVIKQVWEVTDSGETEIPFITPRQMFDVNNPRYLRPEISQRPHWTIPVIDIAPTQDFYTAEELAEQGLGGTDRVHNPGGDTKALGVRSVWLSCAPTQDTTYKVLCSFYSKKLVLDSDVNFWSLEEPGLAVLAARYQIEVQKHRNRTGAREFLEAIRTELNEIELHMSMEENEGPPSRWIMGGGY